MLLIFGIISFFAVLAIGIWNFMVNGLYMPLDPGISLNDQLCYVLLHPLDFIQIIMNTSFKYAAEFPIISIGSWAYLDTPLPKWIYSIYFFAIFLISIFDKNMIKINFKQIYVLLSVFLLITGVIFLLEYLTWTYVGANVIYGIQGRYLIPILPLLFLFLYEGDHNTKNRILIESMITLFIIFILSKVIFIFINHYYMFYF